MSTWPTGVFSAVRLASQRLTQVHLQLPVVHTDGERVAWDEGGGGVRHQDTTACDCQVVLARSRLLVEGEDQAVPIEPPVHGITPTHHMTTELDEHLECPTGDAQAMVGVDLGREVLFRRSGSGDLDGRLRGFRSRWRLGGCSGLRSHRGLRKCRSLLRGSTGQSGAGGCVGVESLAAALSEERGTVEDVLEPYLIQQGYIMRTSRGRMATSRAYRHFGLEKPRSPENDLFTPEPEPE